MSDGQSSKNPPESLSEVMTSGSFWIGFFIVIILVFVAVFVAGFLSHFFWSGFWAGWNAFDQFAEAIQGTFR